MRLVGTCSQTIIDNVSELLDDSEAYDLMSRATNPYGDGKACQRIAAKLSELP